jgi:hypothetical protein
MRRESSEMADLYCPIRWATIIDNSLNDTGKVIPMGEPGTSWYYEVPYLGMDILTGKDFNGNATYRKANENDARMYPNRRLMIASEDVELYDGPTFNWHPWSDLIPLSLDKWPWEPAGFSMVHDGWPLQRALDMIDRGMHQKISAELNMPLAYDINAVNKQEAEEVDPFESHGRYGYDGDRVEGTPFKTIVPPDVYKVTPETLAVRKEFEEELDYQTQTRDMIELAKARALGKSMDQDEALISANGPVVKDMCRDMEMGLCQVGKQVGYLILQYENTARLMGLVGADGVTPEVFDYNPRASFPRTFRMRPFTTPMKTCFLRSITTCSGQNGLPTTCRFTSCRTPLTRSRRWRSVCYCSRVSSAACRSAMRRSCSRWRSRTSRSLRRVTPSRSNTSRR